MNPSGRTFSPIESTDHPRNGAPPPAKLGRSCQLYLALYRIHIAWARGKRPTGDPLFAEDLC